MNLQKLTTLANNGEIQELELLSLVGGFYLAQVSLDYGQFILLDDAAKPMHLRSVSHLRGLLQAVPPFPCVLVQQCAHDEMCGQREEVIEVLRTPFSLAMS
ncbi:DUF6482 family protein [Pseudomonas sp. Pseusp122]|uniref:DUF6482 family protein n=1 Tax=unclassified Pseudomonas TaxID=196821 RepID=UPI0039A66EA2